MDRQRELERKILRGQQAKEALSFMDEFEAQEAERLWRACKYFESDDVKYFVSMAPVIQQFKEILHSAVNDGLVAARDLEVLEAGND